SRCDGRVQLSLAPKSGARATSDDSTFDATLTADSLTAAGFPVSNVVARFVSGQAGQVILPQCSGDFFGGRVSATAVAHAGPSTDPAQPTAVPGAAGARDYQVDIVVAGARFAPLLEFLADRSDLVMDRAAAYHLAGSTD